MVRNQPALKVLFLDISHRDIVRLGGDAVPDLLNQQDTLCDTELVDPQGPERL
jgi:hypothetical protein